MKNVNKSVLIWYSPEEMFALVADVARYPEFLPWCSHTQVLEQDAHSMTAEVGMSMGALRKSFVTRNVHEGQHKISMRLIKGPFSRLEGHWMFHPVGDGSQRACKVQLQLDYGSPATGWLPGGSALCPSCAARRSPPGLGLPT